MPGKLLVEKGMPFLLNMHLFMQKGVYLFFRCTRYIYVRILDFILAVFGGTRGEQLRLVLGSSQIAIHKLSRLCNFRPSLLYDTCDVTRDDISQFFILNVSTLYDTY